MGVLLTLQEHRKNFESLLGHLVSLWAATPGVTFESLVGHFNSFCVPVELGGRPLHKPRHDLMANSRGRQGGCERFLIQLGETSAANEQARRSNASAPTLAPSYIWFNHTLENG